MDAGNIKTFKMRFRSRKAPSCSVNISGDAGAHFDYDAAGGKPCYAPFYTVALGKQGIRMKKSKHLKDLGVRPTHDMSVPYTR